MTDRTNPVANLLYMLNISTNAKVIEDLNNYAIELSEEETPENGREKAQVTEFAELAALILREKIGYDNVLERERAN
jgi:hypothetical protein